MVEAGVRTAVGRRSGLRWNPRWNRTVLSIASVATFVAVWELVPALGLIDPFYTSQPTRVLGAAQDVLASGDFGHHVWVSLQEFAWGFLLALAAGIPSGLVMGTTRVVRQMLDPLIMALYATPRLALLPIIIVWLGIGMESKIAVVFIGALIPIIVNTMAGISEADPALVRAARSFCAKRRDIFLQVLLPGALPAVMSGVRLGMGRGVLGVVVGEMYVSQEGVGNQITHFGSSMRVDHLVFYTIVVSVFGFAVVTAARKVEERLQHWREH